MPIVTDIKRQKRSEVRFNVYLDGTYTFALTDLELSTSGIRVGQDLSPEEVREYQSRAEYDNVYSKAVRFVGVRPRSRREVADYLARKQAPEATVEQAMKRLEQLGLLDDEAFAASWVANRQLLRPRSKRRLEQELTAKGVSRDDIGAALAEVDSDTELEMLVQVAEKKQRLSQYHSEEKLMAYLARQGYPYELIKKALEIISQRSDDI